jgi:GTP cyclohydrolase II
MKQQTRPAKARVVAEAQLPTSFGGFRILAIQGAGPNDEAVAIVHGDLKRTNTPLVRVHSQCLTGDVFTSRRCDCRAQLELSLRKIARAPAGVLLYLPQEGRGIGLINKIKAYALQDSGLDTVEANRRLGFAADSRDYEFAAKALKVIGLTSVRLLSNNPDKVQQLERSGIHVTKRVPCRPRVTRHSRSYLLTKREKLGHLLADL